MSEDSVILDEVGTDDSCIFDCSEEWWSQNEEES